MTKIAQLWQEHQVATFPADSRGEALHGIDLVMLDADAAGCVSSFLGCSGRLDENRYEILASCRRDIDRVLADLQVDAFEYFARLGALAQAVLTASK